MAAFSHAGDDDSSLARQQQVYSVSEVLTQSIRQLNDGISLRHEGLLGNINGGCFGYYSLGCEGHAIIHLSKS
jgi:hypothetical protein